ncbi:MAG: tetratricopeptide repeat protein [Ignavibacteriaceae bacterium]|nr:tetratricopeptide repeat protein [Ignavibacteriaceae bacterium]
MAKYILLLWFTVIVLICGNLHAQDTTKSLAFKNNKPGRNYVSFYQPDLSYTLWEQFELNKEAQAGNAKAQHELGIRYLTGKDMPSDTIKGAYWIKKAAEQKLTAAQFNYGILLINGWGVEWNPYEAFKQFYYAAMDGMPQAEYVMGLLYTDNLIIKRDMIEAYKWVQKSANKNYIPAKETLPKLTKYAPTEKDTIPKLATNFTNYTSKGKDKQDNDNEKSLQSSSGLVYIDFDMISDSIQTIKENDLIEDIRNSSNKELANSVKMTKDSVSYIDSTSMHTFLEAADYGCPEALNLLGYYSQNGIKFNKDPIGAAEFYIRSSKTDSRKGSILLYDIIKEKDFFSILKKEVDKNNPDAMYVWYGIQSLGFDKQITDKDAFNLLHRSAELRNLISITELGQDYFKGTFVKQDKEKGVGIWKLASDQGSKDAKIRIEIANLYGEIDVKDKVESFNYLKTAEEKGSLLAELSLADCYDKGIIVPKEKAKAIYYFRSAAVRGSVFAYNELKRLYDEMRPKDFEAELSK